jgi:hypothetical protein
MKFKSIAMKTGLFVVILGFGAGDFGITIDSSGNGAPGSRGTTGSTSSTGTGGSGAGGDTATEASLSTSAGSSYHANAGDDSGFITDTTAPVNGGLVMN